MKTVEQEALRYLGYRGKPAENRVMKMLSLCLEELSESCPGRWVSRRFQLRHGNGFVEIGDLKVESRDLAAHLTGCGEAELFAATLGAPADRILERYSKTDLGMAAIFQAAAAARIESCCDEAENEIARETSRRGLFLRPRYSPGYGDFSILHQCDILRILDTQKRIGLFLTDSFMLVPAKSVTAVIGLTTDRTHCNISRCMECGASDCPFRKE